MVEHRVFWNGSSSMYRRRKCPHAWHCRWHTTNCDTGWSRREPTQIAQCTLKRTHVTLAGIASAAWRQCSLDSHARYGRPKLAVACCKSPGIIQTLLGKATEDQNLLGIKAGEDHHTSEVLQRVLHIAPTHNVVPRLHTAMGTTQNTNTTRHGQSAV